MTPVPLRYVANIFCRRRSRAIFTVACLLVFGLLAASTMTAWNDVELEVDWEAEFERARRESLRDHMSFYVAGRAQLRQVPVEWTARDRCPACFGTDMCDAVDSQELLIEVPDKMTPANRKGVYLGRWKDLPVVVKLLADWYPPEFRNFDEYVCLKATGERGCKVSTAIISDYIQEDKHLFSPDRLLSAWKISYNHTGPLALTYALCLTEELVESFSRLYNVNGSAQLTRRQRAMLLTSMVVQPESLMLRFLKTAESDRLAPRVYGACGRMLVVEHGGRPLQTYVNASFTERAELALQLISLMKRFWHADRSWFALYSDIQYENIAVSHYNQVYLIDHEHLSIIQSVRSPRQRQQQPDVDRPRHRDLGDRRNDPDERGFHDNAHLLDKPVVCNSECFRGLLANLSRHDLDRDTREAQCGVLHDVSLSFMYATLCRNIFIDSPSQRGLLHGVPDDDDFLNRGEKVSEALKECVHETRPGGRVDAVEQLSEMLSLYTGLRLE